MAATPTTAPEPRVAVDNEELASRLRLNINRLHRRLRQESLAGLSPAQASALGAVNRLGSPTLGELAANALFFVTKRPIALDGRAAKLLTGEARQLLAELLHALEHAVWEAGSLEQQVRNFAEGKGIGLGAVAQPLRAALTGSAASPGIFWVMEVLGREESLGRIADVAEAACTI